MSDEEAKAHKQSVAALPFREKVQRAVFAHDEMIAMFPCLASKDNEDVMDVLTECARQWLELTK